MEDTVAERTNPTKSLGKIDCSFYYFLGPFDVEKYFGNYYMFILDAQEAGNIGRFLNHSCEPNVFVQFVFVDTHGNFDFKEN